MEKLYHGGFQIVPASLSTLPHLLPQLMRIFVYVLTFVGPVPRNDLIKIEIAFSKYTDKETITYYEFLNTMQDLRKEVS